MAVLLSTIAAARGQDCWYYQLAAAVQLATIGHGKRQRGLLVPGAVAGAWPWWSSLWCSGFWALEHRQRKRWDPICPACADDIRRLPAGGPPSGWLISSKQLTPERWAENMPAGHCSAIAKATHRHQDIGW